MLRIYPSPVRWVALLALSAFVSATLSLIKLPAALLLGPMIAAITIAINGGGLKVPRYTLNFCQAMIGCLIARSLTADIVSTFSRDWPVFIGVVAAVIVASLLLGALLSKWRVLPGTTALWGVLPGAASAMMLMSEAYQADTRLVALMQYLRVLLVTLAASLVARFWMPLPPPGAAPAGTVWFPPLDLIGLAETLSIAGVGMLAGRLLRVPAGMLLMPMLIGGVLHAMGLVKIELPPWLLVTGYSFLGWGIGMRFTRKVLVHAGRALPATFFSILSLMGICAALAWLLVGLLHVDALTAYLATSPGGMDAVAIIAAGSNVDIPFVMALQAVRLVLVLMLGPGLSRWVVGLLQPGMSGLTPPLPDEATLQTMRDDEAETD